MAAVPEILHHRQRACKGTASSGCTSSHGAASGDGCTTNSSGPCGNSSTDSCCAAAAAYSGDGRTTNSSGLWQQRTDSCCASGGGSTYSNSTCSCHRKDYRRCNNGSDNADST
jgi:hypothetical protein